MKVNDVKVATCLRGWGSAKAAKHRAENSMPSYTCTSYHAEESEGNPPISFQDMRFRTCTVEYHAYRITTVRRPGNCAGSLVDQHSERLLSMCQVESRNQSFQQKALPKLEGVGNRQVLC